MAGIGGQQRKPPLSSRLSSNAQRLRRANRLWPEWVWRSADDWCRWECDAVEHGGLPVSAV